MRRRMMVAAIAATTMAVGAALTGCSSGNSSGKVTITFWDDNGGPDRTPIYRSIISKFEAANPNIHINYVGIPIDSVAQKYNTAISGGSPPDVGSISTTYLAGIIGQNALEPLDSELKSSSLKDELVGSFTDETRDIAPDHKLYAIPYTGNAAVMWYRSDWVKQAGLKAPKTWNDFYADAAKLTDSGANRYGYTIRGGAGSISSLVQVMYAESGIDKFFVNGKSTVNDPKNVSALSKYAALYKKVTATADVNNDYPQMVAEFDGGSAGMMLHNLGSLANHQKALPGKFGSEPIPPAPDGQYNIVPSPLSTYGIFQAGAHKEQAWKFVQFLLSAQSNSQWNQKVGQIPANTNVRAMKWVQDTPSVQSCMQVLEDPKTRTVLNPIYLPDYGSITEVDLPPLWQKVLIGKMSAKSFADTFAKELNKAQQNYQQHHS